MAKTTSFLALFLLAVALVLVASCSRDAADPVGDAGTDYAFAPSDIGTLDDDDNGTRTPGYWKNHSAAWPVGQLTLGGVEYSKQKCMEMLGRPARGDHSAILCRALIAAKLNLMIGCEGECIEAEISSADFWFAQYNMASSAIEIVAMSAKGRPLADVLDDYNNGLLCAPARED